MRENAVPTTAAALLAGAGPVTVTGITGQCVAWGGEIDGHTDDNPGA